MNVPTALKVICLLLVLSIIPIVGCGGISTARDVVEMMMAGASAVEVGTANLINPYACRDIIEELPDVMQRLKIDNLTDIIGAAL